MIRAVLDTTVAVAAGKSQSSSSPNREIIDRWLQGEFTLLLSKDIAAEYATKLRERGVGDHAILTFLRRPHSLYAQLIAPSSPMILLSMILSNCHSPFVKIRSIRG